MTCGIYAIRNTVNGKIYIGSSKNIENRWVQHCSDLDCRKHHNRHLQYAWAKYGRESFSFEILEEVNVDWIVRREQYYLDTLNPEYNLSKSAHRPDVKLTVESRAKLSRSLRGRKVSPETRRKIAESLIGKPFSEERCRNISDGRRGKGGGHLLTEESRRKISVTLTGRTNGPHSEETRRKISEKHKGMTHSEEARRLISEVQKGKVIPEMQRRKISETLKGRPKPQGFGMNPSAETLAKRSEGIRKAWARRKEQQQTNRLSRNSGPEI